MEIVKLQMGIFYVMIRKNRGKNKWKEILSLELGIKKDNRI